MNSTADIGNPFKRVQIGIRLGSVLKRRFAPGIVCRPLFACDGGSRAWRDTDVIRPLVEFGVPLEPCVAGLTLVVLFLVCQYASATGL
jgi:hypothetical protein